MTTINHEELERAAIDLWRKSKRRKAETWDKAMRNHWRDLATKEIEHRRSISIGDALMGIFGFRRVKP